MYICPKCSEPLTVLDRRLECINKHSFDISAKGYVNLLLGAKAGVHGDNKEMITARRAFLSLGHYSPIINTVADIIKSSVNKDKIKILDAGCGEGYYTSGIKNKLSELGIAAETYGIDVSKDAVALAAKAYKDISFSVASVNALPFKNQSFDAVLSLFAPLCETEFSRVMNKNGILITVSPSENHLFGLKSAVYDTPYKNPPSTFLTNILTKVSETVNEWEITLDNKTDIQNLFKMTPYYYKTSPTDIEKAMSLTSLTTTIGFNFGIYKL
ncbi:MAG: methyltransferase domain-containing protein [Clostridia bacterium]|nr:methyltransferase domain-containing protein [Clostridia bacterium]